MRPQNHGEGEFRREGITRSNLPALSTLLVPIGLGMLLLGMISQTPQNRESISQEAGFQEAGFTDGPQPKPATCNKGMKVILRQEYCLYQRVLAQGRLLDPEWQRVIHEAVDAYNQVAGDIDPSAFDQTTLPRHLDYPSTP